MTGRHIFSVIDTIYSMNMKKYSVYIGPLNSVEEKCAWKIICFTHKIFPNIWDILKSINVMLMKL